jgi:hypothetical protein
MALVAQERDGIVMRQKWRAIQPSVIKMMARQGGLPV